MPRTVFRPFDGILLLDKPPGMSSNQALQRVRHLFRAEKAGHTGSLDPLATGLLPVCFGEATKIAGYLLGSAKAYEVLAALGTDTDTDDADGQPLRTREISPLTRPQVEQELQHFIGRIQQRPPIYSALKQGGEPMYAKARRGEAIEMAEREVHVHSIELLDLSPDTLGLRIECGSGTYVRSIVRDLGERLGCGAHVRTLRRLWVEPFVEQPMFTLGELMALAEQGEALLDSVVLPLEAGLVAWPRVALDTAQAQALGRGQPVSLPGAIACEQVNAATPEGRSLGLARIDEAGVLHARRLFRWACAG